jgi:hypothetical protein
LPYLNLWLQLCAEQSSQLKMINYVASISFWRK